jgi:16S rRNA (uracil1498-N3)-methyltransferase
MLHIRAPIRREGGRPAGFRPEPPFNGASMPAYDFKSPRLYVDTPLQAGGAAALDATQAHYLQHVLRLGPGAEVLAFNGRDGEWRARLAAPTRRTLALEMVAQTRPQTAAGDLHYLFAPLKHARLDYMVQKAVEMGASRLCPVLTRHTHNARVNLERMRANAIEAAEQCGVLNVPEIAAPVSFDAMLAALSPERLLVFCDEAAEVGDPIAALSRYRQPGAPPAPLAVLIGPEGGFAPEERDALLRRTNVVRLALGPRILRADTAAVAALALTQAVLGDWG